MPVPAEPSLGQTYHTKFPHAQEGEKGAQYGEPSKQDNDLSVLLVIVFRLSMSVASGHAMTLGSVLCRW